MTNTKPEQDQCERRARLFWVSGVILLLGLQLSIGFTAIVLASSDPSVAIVPDYHTKALEWDSRSAARGRLVDNGWSVAAAMRVGEATEAGNRLMIAVSDLEGFAVEGLSIRAKYYHHARGQEVRIVDLQMTQAGLYEAVVANRRSGLWQIELEIRDPRGRTAVWEGTVDTVDEQTTPR